MKSAILLLGASLAVARAEGFFGFPKNTQTLVAQDPSATASEPAAPTDLSDAVIELGHCSGGHCHKPEPPKCPGPKCHKPEPTTVTKVCKECVTITKPVTVLVPDPTTVVKTRMCTTTMIRSRTVTRCVDHTKTDTKYCPVYKTSVQTVTVDPTCTPKPKCHHWQVQHVVEEGDYCENLATVYNTTVEDIQATNTFLNSTCDLTTGDVLCIPRDDGDDYSVKKRDAVAITITTGITIIITAIITMVIIITGTTTTAIMTTIMAAITTDAMTTIITIMATITTVTTTMATTIITTDIITTITSSLAAKTTSASPAPALRLVRARIDSSEPLESPEQ